MSTYATRADLVPGYLSEREILVCTNSGSAQAVAENTAVTAVLQGSAFAEINAYVGFRYTLPLSSVPELLTALECRITKYRMFTSGGSQPPEWVTEDYKAALATLKEIRDGKIDLGLTVAGETAGAPAVSAVRVTSVKPRFGRTGLGGF